MIDGCKIKFRNFSMEIKKRPIPNSFLVVFSGSTDIDSRGWETPSGDRKRFEDDFKFMWNPLDAPSPEGLMNIDREAVFRKNWKDTDLINEWRKKSVKCAEALVPYSVSVEYFKGAIVVNDKSAIRLKEIIGERFKDLKILVDRTRFF